MTKAEMEKRITKMEQELNSLKTQLNKPEKKTGWEKPEAGQSYWITIQCRDSFEDIWYSSCYDNVHYDNGNCFTSKELAENITRYQSLDLRIRRRIAEICEPVYWNEYNQEKWLLYYNHFDKDFTYSSTPYYHTNAWHFDSKENAKKIAEEFKDELIWYFTEFKDRMDTF